MLSVTTDSGFQAEKYRGLCLQLSWDRATLVKMVDLRIAEMIRDRWTGMVVTHRHLLPGTIGKKKEQPIQFMIDRTLMRPRDIIAFFNLCAGASAGEPTVHPTLLTRVESVHSEDRLSSLCDEWSVDYPYLRQLTRLLHQRPISFQISHLTDDQMVNLVLSIYDLGDLKQGEDARTVEEFYLGKSTPQEFRRRVARILYRVGAVGLKPETHGHILWSYIDQAEMPENQISDATKVYPHKMLWRALGVVG
jgi:hypothetical protein